MSICNAFFIQYKTEYFKLCMTESRIFQVFNCLGKNTFFSFSKFRLGWICKIWKSVKLLNWIDFEFAFHSLSTPPPAASQTCSFHSKHLKVEQTKMTPNGGGPIISRALQADRRLTARICDHNVFWPLQSQSFSKGLISILPTFWHFFRERIWPLG